MALRPYLTWPTKEGGGRDFYHRVFRRPGPGAYDIRPMSHDFLDMYCRPPGWWSPKCISITYGGAGRISTGDFCLGEGEILPTDLLAPTIYELWPPELESNQRPKGLEPFALPSELSGDLLIYSLHKIYTTSNNYLCQDFAFQGIIVIIISLC
jgi:hypothetical protein